MAARFQIDWERIVERIMASDGKPDDAFFFIIPDAGRHLLLSQAERLKWESTFTTGNYSEIETIVDQTIDALMGDERMSEISDAIRYLADTIQFEVNQTNNNNNTSSGGGCGCGSPDGNFLIEPPDWPEGEEYPLFPPDFTDVPGGLTQQELCSMAAYFVDLYEATYADIEDYWAGISITISAVKTFLSKKFPQGALIPWLAMILTSLAIGLETALLGGLAGKMADMAAYYKEELKCALASVNNAEDGEKAFHAVLAQGKETHGRVAYAVLYLVAKMIDWEKFYNGTVPVPPEYANAECCIGIAPEGFEFVPLTLTQVVPDTGEGSGTSGHTIDVQGDEIVIAAVADGAAKVFTPQTYWAAPDVSEDRYVGFILRVSDRVNCAELRFASGDAVNAHLWNGATRNDAEDVVYVIHDDANVGAFQAAFPDNLVIVATNDVGVNTCAMPASGIEVGTRSTTAGGFSVRIRQIYLIKEIGLACQ